MQRSSAFARPETIRSRHNPRLKDLRRRLLHSDCGEDGLIAVEGEHLVREAVRSGLSIHTLFLLENRVAQPDWHIPGNPLVLSVGKDAFDYASAMESPQGIAALVEAPRWSLEALLQAAEPVLLVLAGLQNPGNLGTIIRTAEAFRATGILLTPGTVNPWNQKVLRASAGSSFRLPVVSLDTDAALGRLREKEIPLYAAAADGEIAADDGKLRSPVALAIGNEGAGVPKSVLRWCSGSVRIPYPGPVESLNAAVSAAILLYEISREELSAGGANP